MVRSGNMSFFLPYQGKGERVGDFFYILERRRKEVIRFEVLLIEWHNAPDY